MLTTNTKGVLFNNAKKGDNINLLGRYVEHELKVNIGAPGPIKRSVDEEKDYRKIRRVSFRLLVLQSTVVLQKDGSNRVTKQAAYSAIILPFFRM